MATKFERVKECLMDLNMKIVREDTADELLVVDDYENGIQNLIIDCEDPIIVLEQFILDIQADSGDFFKRLLQMNRELIHGAFVLDEAGKRLFWRDTLQLENLDPNELEASVQALSLGLAENADELLEYARR